MNCYTLLTVQAHMPPAINGRRSADTGRLDRLLKPARQPSLPAQPNTMEEPPPGGASTREDGLSVRKFLLGVPAMAGASIVTQRHGRRTKEQGQQGMQTASTHRQHLQLDIARRPRVGAAPPNPPHAPAVHNRCLPAPAQQPFYCSPHILALRARVVVAASGLAAGQLALRLGRLAGHCRRRQGRGPCSHRCHRLGHGLDWRCCGLRHHKGASAATGSPGGTASWAGQDQLTGLLQGVMPRCLYNLQQGWKQGSQPAARSGWLRCGTPHDGVPAGRPGGHPPPAHPRLDDVGRGITTQGPAGVAAGGRQHTRGGLVGDKVAAAGG